MRQAETSIAFKWKKFALGLANLASGRVLYATEKFCLKNSVTPETNIALRNRPRFSNLSLVYVFNAVINNNVARIRGVRGQERR